MKRFLGVIVLSLFITTISYSDIRQRYSIGDKIRNKVVLDNKIRMKLSGGEWEVIERTRWNYNAFTGEYILLVKTNRNEIEETLSLGFIDTGGKRIADVNTWLYEVIFTNKHDGCYERPEYFKLELFHKGSTTNCMIVDHVEVNKYIYNPDDKETSWMSAKIIEWIKKNSIKLPKIMLSAEHIFFSRLASAKFYTISHAINPKFFKGPKTKYITEDTSEYHPFNIDRYPEHRKFMNEFLSKESLIHIDAEEKIGIKEYQKLKLSKYVSKKIEKEKNTIEMISQIKKLNNLYKSGVLTKEEFTKAKKKVLN